MVRNFQSPQGTATEIRVTSTIKYLPNGQSIVVRDVSFKFRNTQTGRYVKGGFNVKDVNDRFVQSIFNNTKTTGQLVGIGKSLAGQPKIVNINNGKRMLMQRLDETPLNDITRNRYKYLMEHMSPSEFDAFYKANEQQISKFHSGDKSYKRRSMESPDDNINDALTEKGKQTYRTGSAHRLIDKMCEMQGITIDQLDKLIIEDMRRYPNKYDRGLSKFNANNI